MAQSRLEVLSATYGAGFNVVDLTDHVRTLVRGDALAITIDTATLGQDPAPGTEKSIRIRYRFGGKEELIVAKDFDSIRIPPKSGFSITELSVDRGAIPPLQIIAASYGFENRTNDVRERVVAQIRDNQASFKVTNDVMGGDPAVGKTKTLDVTYTYRGQILRITQREDRVITIPDPGASVIGTAQGPSQPASGAQLQIIAASYGFENRKNDVRQRVESQINGNRASFKVTNDAMGGDPAVGKMKTLEVTYLYQGQTYKTTQREDRVITIPDSGSSPVSPVPAAAGPSPGFDNGRPPAVRIFSARYVRGTEMADVRPRVQPMLQNDRLSLGVNPGQLGVSGGGYLVVRYEYRGRTFEKSAPDGQTLAIP
jgi:hypothetical protein